MTVESGIGRLKLDFIVSIYFSYLSIIPPCPGMMSPKSLILNALLKPEAKKPPKGPMMEAKRERKKVWTKKGKKVTVSFICNNRRHVANVCMQRKVNKAPKIRIQDLTMGDGRVGVVFEL